MDARTYNSKTCAGLLRHDVDWFYRNRQQLIERGFPAALDMPGHPRYPAAKVDAFAAGYVTPTAANDVAPAAKPEGERWVQYVADHYARA